jgi:hypothetical protein
MGLWDDAPADAVDADELGAQADEAGRHEVEQPVD